MNHSVFVFVPCAVLAALPAVASANNPYATAIASYNAGSNAAPGYTDSAGALGWPTRFTGVGIWPGVVSAFNAPWMADEIVSIGAGGHLAVQFDSPIVDHPAHPFGIDLLIFSNSWFIDSDYPNGNVKGLFIEAEAIVEVSEDGKNWIPVSWAGEQGLFPTIGYADAHPYATTPGRVPTDFTKPVDPSLTMDDFFSLNHDEVVELYAGSGGGLGIDISSAGLAEVHFVRVRVPEGAKAAFEVDAFVKVRPPSIVGDLNNDGSVDVLDLLILLGAWGDCPASPPPGRGAGGEECPADLNNSGGVDVQDLLLLLSNWG